MEIKAEGIKEPPLVDSLIDHVGNRESDFLKLELYLFFLSYEDFIVFSLLDRVRKSKGVLEN